MVPPHVSGNTPRPTCNAGHPWTEENTVWFARTSPVGVNGRYCRWCKATNERRRYRATSGPRRPGVPRETFVSEVEHFWAWGMRDDREMAERLGMTVKAFRVAIKRYGLQKPRGNNK